MFPKNTQGQGISKTAKGPYRFSSQAATCYYQPNHSKGRGNPVKCLAQGHNKRICRPVFTLLLLDAKRQAGKL